MPEITNFLNILATITLIFLIAIFIILSFIFNYHWSRYEISIYRTALIKKIYFTVSIFLLLILIFLFLNLNQ